MTRLRDNNICRLRRPSDTLSEIEIYFLSLGKVFFCPFTHCMPLSVSMSVFARERSKEERVRERSKREGRERGLPRKREKWIETER